MHFSRETGCSKGMKAGFVNGRRLRTAVSSLVVALLLVGCCDKAKLERCRAEASTKWLLRDVPTKPAKGGMRLDIRAITDVTVDASVTNSGCVAGKAVEAEVKVDWEVLKPEVSGVRASVGKDDVVSKVWMETGPEGHGITGPWIEDGAYIQLADSVTGRILGEIRAVGLTCGGS